MTEDHIDMCWWLDGWGPRSLNNYSEDIGDAWLVALWLRERFGQFELSAGVQWHCMCDHIHPHGSGDTAEEAVCKAALLPLCAE